MELTPDAVLAYVWLLDQKPSDPTKLPSEGPTCLLRLPYNPLTKSMPNDTLYIYSHAP